MTLRFTHEAEADLSDAARWYARQARGLDTEFVRAVQGALAVIERNPAVFPVVRRDARKALMRRFPYCLLYVPRGLDIVVIAVYHTSRDPLKFEKRAD